MTENLYTEGCLRTVSGAYVNIANPDPARIHIRDIAHGLGKCQRFANQLPRFFSVAEHSIMVADLVPDELKPQALMHDASDFLLGDMAYWVKVLCPDFKAVETNMMDAIAMRYGFAWPKHKLVHEADMQVRQWEWDNIMLGAFNARYTTAKSAASAFLVRFNQLFPQHAI